MGLDRSLCARALGLLERCGGSDDSADAPVEVSTEQAKIELCANYCARHAECELGFGYASQGSSPELTAWGKAWLAE